MDAVSAALVSAATAASQGQLRQQVAYTVLREAMDAQAASAAMLLQALPQPSLETRGAVGRLLNVYA
jgi:hypothetical protein